MTFQKVKCNGCSREIIFAHDSKTGARVPIDPAAPVYRVAIVAGRQVAFRVNGKDAPVSDDGAIYGVTHFATCPNANEFGGSKRMQDASDKFDATSKALTGAMSRGPRPPEERVRILEDLARSAKAFLVRRAEDDEIDVTAEIGALEADVDRLDAHDKARA